MIKNDTNDITMWSWSPNYIIENNYNVSKIVYVNVPLYMSKYERLERATTNRFGIINRIIKRTIIINFFGSHWATE